MAVHAPGLQKDSSFGLTRTMSPGKCQAFALSSQGTRSHRSAYGTPQGGGGNDHP
ncbi:hypothetical protein IG631_23690 [Alternaria alternata]|nr:hypothetical protein IG631_23690 [Alternaria alternata]